MNHALSKPHIGTIIVLGGWLVRENGAWRSTFFEELGGLGDRLRVEAAAYLYRNAEGPVTVIVSGGRGKLSQGASPVAKVLRKELIELGVRASYMREERTSNNTYEQLRSCAAMLTRFRRKRIMLISNASHLPRILALIQHGPKITTLRQRLRNRQLFVQSAEDVLLTQDRKKWGTIIRTAYASPALQALIRKRTFGAPLLARVAVGYYLPTARKEVPYKRVYAAGTKGGGVVLDSGAHVVDYLTVLCGSRHCHSLSVRSDGNKRALWCTIEAGTDEGYFRCSYPYFTPKVAFSDDLHIKLPL